MADSTSVVGNDTGDFEDDKTSFEKFLEKAYAGISGVIYVMTRDMWSWTSLAVAGVLIDFLQILSFHFYNHIVWNWDITVTSWLGTIANGARVYNFGDSTAASIQLAFIVVMSVVALFLLDALWVGWQFSESRVRFAFTVKILRGLADLMTGPFYIPILSVFVEQIPCAPGIDNCWSTGTSTLHIVTVIVSLIFGLMFIAICLLLSATYYSRDPTGSCPLAQPFSRVAFTMMCVKTVLTICFVLLSPYTSMRLVLIVLLLLGTSAVAGLYSWQMPYFRFDYNILRAATFWVLSWASVCLLILEISSSGNTNQTSASILFYIGSPIVVLCCVVGMRFRKTSITRRALADIHSPSEIELKVRFMLESVTAARRLRGLGHAMGVAATLNVVATPNVTTSSSAAPKSVSFSGDTLNKQGTRLTRTSASAQSADSGDESSVHETRSDDGSTSMSVEETRPNRSVQSRLEQLAQKQRLLEESKALDESEEMYAYGVQRFGHFAAMHLLRAHHCFYYSESKGAALSHLARAESRSPSVDENFAIFFFRKATHESFSGGGGNSDILQYIQMQKTMADAKKYDEQAVRHTLSFWDILLTSQPDLNRMNDLAELINSSMLSAMSAFKLMMRLSGGNSIAVLRMYAGFLLDVANEPTYGHELLVRAEELEDLQSKEHSEGTQENANGVPSLDDRHAIVSISGEMKKLGTIFQVNATALRLLGYNKYEMINRNVTLIVPAPFAQHHHNYLRRYMDLGDASVLNKTRALFAMHKTGYLVPINLYVREVSGESEHAFLGVLKEQVSQIQSAIVDPNYNIFGCTVVLGNLFNSSVEEMRAGSYHLSRWFPSFLQNLPDMKSPSGAEFKVPTELGKEVSVRVWIVPMHVSGESVDWIHLRAQIHDASGHTITARDIDITKKPSFAKPSKLHRSGSKSKVAPPPIMEDDEYDDRARLLPESDDDAIVSDNESGPSGKATPRMSGKSAAELNKEDSVLASVAFSSAFASALAMSAAPTPTNTDAPISTKAMKKLKKQQSIAVSGSESTLPLLIGDQSSQSLEPSASTTSFGASDSQTALLPVSIMQRVPSISVTAPPPLPPTLRDNVLSNLMNDEPVVDRKARFERMKSLDSVDAPSVSTTPAQGFRDLPKLPLPSAMSKGTPKVGMLTTLRIAQDKKKPPMVRLRSHASLGGTQDEDLDKKSLAKSNSSAGSSASRNSIHSKFRAFARSRDSQSLSPTLRRLQIALMMTIVLVLVVSPLAYYLINSRITLYTSSLSDITVAGGRRSDPVTFAMMLYQMMLATYGFFDLSIIPPLKDVLLPLRLDFELTDNNLYLEGAAHAQVLADPKLQSLYESTVVPLVILRNGVVMTQMRSMWDSTQELEYDITDVIVSDLSALSYTNPTFFFVIRNADDAILTALNESTFLYQVNTAKSIDSLQSWSLALMIAPLGCLLFVVIAVVRPTVQTIESNKMAVLRLFLDIPMQLVQIFRARIARRLVVIENSEDGAFGKKSNKLSEDESDEIQFQEEDEAAVIEQVLGQINVENEPAAPFAQQVAVSSGAQTHPSGVKVVKDREAERRARQAKADANINAKMFFRRNMTLIKISSYIVFAFVYFITTYQLFFAMQEKSWAAKPYQINWSSHTTLTMRSITYHLMVFLTQNFTMDWYPRQTVAEFPPVTVSKIQHEISFVYELIVALGMGSTYYGTLPPETNEQIGVNFVSACLPNLNQPSDCPMFADRTMASGTYASLLSWSTRAANLLSSIQDTLVESAALAHTITNRTLLKEAQLKLLNATLNGEEMTILIKYDTLYLYPVTKYETMQFVEVASNSLTSVNTAKVFVLISWLVFTVLFYLFFFSPLVYNLHVEHRRTTSMLLMISPEVMEHIPSIRAFVSKLSSSAMDT